MSTKCLRCGSVKIKGGLSDGNVFRNGPPARVNYFGANVDLVKCKECGLVWGFSSVEQGGK